MRYAGHDFFVKCDERELLPGLTAEADQLELLSRSKTVTVPKVWAVGADRDYSFLATDYSHLVRWMRIAHLFLVSKLRVYINGVTNHNLGLDLHNSLSTTPQPNTWQRRWSTFFAEQLIGWQLELAAEKGIAFGNIDAIVEHIQQRLASHQPQPYLCCTAIYGPATVRWVRMARTFSTLPAYWGDRSGHGDVTAAY